MTGNTFIKDLAVQSPLTISNTGGSTYLLLGMDTSSISSEANAAAVYTKTQVNGALSAKANQCTTYTKTEVSEVVATKASKSELATTMGGKQPTISTSSELAIHAITANQIYSRYYSPPTKRT